MLPITFAGPVYERLVAEAVARYPAKVFGYLLAADNSTIVTDFILFEENIRNSEGWQPEFHSYGHYFVDHADAGFVATPAESWRVQKEIWARGLREVGVLHSHQRHPANFSEIDWDMHRQRFSDLWHLIVSLRNPQLPQVRAFAVSDTGVQLLTLRVAGAATGPADGPGLAGVRGGASPGEAVREADLSLPRGPARTAGRDEAIARVRLLAKATTSGRPGLKDAAALVAAVGALTRLAGPGVLDDVLAEGVFAGRAERFADHVAPLLEPVPAAAFTMGTDAAQARHFYGESPAHRCELSPFALTRVPVTAGLFALIDPDRGTPAAGRHLPVTSVTWSEAALFALWLGCRLPTEAEWEYACGAGSPAQWCCGSEAELPRYAWYSANSGDTMHPVGTREPSALGLFDLHGNVWEWCQDDYDPDFYRRSPRRDPVNIDGAYQSKAPGAAREKCVRGGSMNGLAEMCRSRFRFHEATGFWAKDLGFRLAAGSANNSG